MWNGLQTQEGLERTFGRTVFLRVGTEDSPCPYTNSDILKREAYGGKQFATAAAKLGKHPTTDYFDCSPKPLFEKEPWADRLPYRELQPRKPERGFLTSDYSKRDEFSLTIRMEQHRQQIKHEARVQRLAAEKRAGQQAAASGSSSAQQSTSPASRQRPLLFDLVFAGEAPLCQKARRDTRNPTLLSRERNFGTMKTTHRLMHCAPRFGRPAMQPATLCA